MKIDSNTARLIIIPLMRKVAAPPAERKVPLKDIMSSRVYMELRDLSLAECSTLLREASGLLLEELRQHVPALEEPKVDPSQQPSQQPSPP